MERGIGGARIARPDARECQVPTDKRRGAARGLRLFRHELLEVEGAREPRIAGANEAKPREPENELHRRIEEFGPDIAIEPHEIVELDAGRIGALDPDVGLREAIREPGDRLHLAMGDDERARADFRMPHLPPGPAEDREPDANQDQAEAGIIVAADRARSAGRPRHGQRPPPLESALASSRADSRLRRIAWA